MLRAGPAPHLTALCHALNAPDLAEVATHLAEQARAEHWTYEEFLAACLEQEVTVRRSGEGEHDDNPLSPTTVGCRLLADDDDNPLAP
jgi:hypothetical protein